MPFLFTHWNRNIIARETASCADLPLDAPSQQDVIDVTYQPNKQTEAKGKDWGEGMVERRQGGDLDLPRRTEKVFWVGREHVQEGGH